MEFYSHVYNTRGKIYHIGYKDGEKFIREENTFCPKLGILTNDETKSTKKTYHDELIEVKEFPTVKAWNDYKKSYGDILKIYDDIEPCYQFINDYYPDTMDYDFSQLSIWLYDIETKKDPETGKFSPPHEAKAEITAITVKDINKKKMFTLSTEKMYPEQMEIELDEDTKFRYKFFYSEEEMLKNFVMIVHKAKPDILSGYNSEGYDDPYVINRCFNVLGEKATRYLSPTKGKVSSYHRVDENGKDIYKNKITGIALVDYMLLYQKNVGKYESNTLSFVAGVELGQDKVNYEEYDNLEELRINNPQKYLEYNIIDVELLSRIDDKRKLFKLITTVAYFTKSNFDDIMSPIKTWDNFIYKYLSKKDISIPPRRSNAPVFSIPGGYIKKDIDAGIYKNVISLDLKALYPSLSITFNISPDTLIEENPISVNMRKIDDRILNREIEHNEDTILTGNGYKYRKDKIGVYPALFQLLMDERDVAKGKKLEIGSKRETLDNGEEKNKLDVEYSNLHTFEQSVKLLMNSGYGILANEHCRYYDPRLASSITLSGQLAIKSASNYVEDYLSKNFNKNKTLLFTHTDSVVGDSIIRTNKGQVSIEDLYNQTEGIEETIGEDDYVKTVTDGTQSLSFNTKSESANMNPIKYIMKHKVKKKMYKISCGSDSVAVTEDHSVIVLRDGQYESVKPNEILKTDQIVKIKTKIISTNEFEVQCLGEQDVWVYDIEVENDHNFFANDILVHNSCYIELGDICDSVEDIDAFYKEHLDDVIKDCYSSLCEYMNTDKNILILKREKICSHFLITAPARYVSLLIDKEGVRYKNPKLDIVGMEIVRSSTPAFIKDYLKETLIKMMKDENVSEYINKTKKEFYKQPPEVIAFPRSANNLAKWIEGNGKFVSGCPIGVRAAHVFNKYIEKNNIDRNMITEGDKIKFLYMKKPNPAFNQHVMGFIRKLPHEELVEYVDYKTQFDKVYYDVIKKIANNVHYDLHKNEETLDDIF